MTTLIIQNVNTLAIADKIPEAYFNAPYGRGKDCNSEIKSLELRIEGIKEAFKNATTKAQQDNLRKDYKKLNKKLKNLKK